MAWTAPATATVGQLVTAAFWNAQIRDNLVASNPVGSYKHFLKAAAAGETVIEGGWLEANGAEVSRSTYSTLFAAVDALARSWGNTTTLGAAVTTTGQTAWTLAAWPGTWPKDGRKFVIQVDSEKVVVTAGFGTTSITVTRAAEGTTAATHSNGASVSTPATDRPFGDGDGATTFTLPDLHGRVPVSMARSGGHADVTLLGRAEASGVVLGSRRPNHYHVTTVSNTSGSGVSGSAGGVRGDAAYAYNTNNVGSNPLDEPANQVTGVWGIKF